MLAEFCKPDAANEKMWDDFVYNSPDASYCHLSGWRHVIERAYGHRTYYLWAHENGETKGVLPLILMQSRLFGKNLVSVPFLDEGGICTRDEKAKIALYQKSIRLYEDLKADSMDMRHRRPSGIVLPRHGFKVTLTLTLADDPDLIWKSFHPTIRNRTRKALMSGVTAVWNGIEGLGDFYDVFSTNMRDLGSPVHSREFFAAVLEEFPNTAKLLLVRHGGQTIGAALVLLFRDTLLIPWPSSKREYFSLCPNNLLYWEAIRWGCEEGYRVLDFGRSSPGTGTYRFKKQWGAKEEPLHWQCVTRRAQLAPTLSPVNPRYRLAVGAWKHLPITVANRLGPLLRKQISN